MIGFKHLNFQLLTMSFFQHSPGISIKNEWIAAANVESQLFWIVSVIFGQKNINFDFCFIVY